MKRFADRLREAHVGVRELDGKTDHYIRDSALSARDERERALLQRYRALPAKRRNALLELMRPADAD